MGIHVGVNGTPKEVVGVYVGVNGTPKECSDIYVGVNGTPKSCYSGVKPGETIFTSSSTFTVPKGVKKIDVFCVGGGGGASGCYYQSSPGSFTGSSGGGGGYTTTKLGVDVNPGQVIPVTVGAGGSWLYSNSEGFKIANAGLSSVGDICSANGGNCAGSWVGGDGGNGGSGGGVALEYSPGFGEEWHKETAGGSDGGNGIAGYRPGGKGQGTTTRYFGESTGTLYSTGGDGTACTDIYPNQTANTGNGGSGAFGFSSLIARNCNKGASGICIIRWGGK